MASTNYAIGVDLGGTAIKFGIVSKKGQLVESLSLETMAQKGPEKVVKQIKKGIDKLAKNSKIKIDGIGIGSPGVVALKKGTVENPPNLPGWGKVHLGSIIKKEFKKNVFVENDANAAAIGEMIFGAGKKLDNFIMITLGTGVGGGIIVGRKLFRGATGAAGEIGHMTLNPSGVSCKCGSRGCIETFGGNNYIIARTKRNLWRHKDSALNTGEEFTTKMIHEAAEAGDEYAIQVILDVAHNLGYGLASIINLLDIGKVIVGGGVAGFGDRLLSTIENTIKERVLKPLVERVSVIPAKLKNEAGIKGASALVYYSS